MSAISEVLLWALRVNGKKDAKPHQILDIKADATLDDAQTAFHKIARIAHPDLHRTTLSAEDLENVTLAYSRAAAAYQEFRTQRVSTARMRPIAGVAPATGTPRAASTPAAGTPSPAAPASSSTNAATAMSSKALIYYRKAELALRRGDLKGAILQLKMAIAADPQSTFLRTALAEVEAEVQKAT
jgi:hypothetical protein